MRLAAALAPLVALLACASAVAGEAAQYRPNPRDMAAARASLLRASDLGVSWTGGPKKASRPYGLECGSSRVVTGAAEAEFSAVGGLDIQSHVQVLQDEAMVRADVGRAGRAAAVRCLATGLEQTAGLGAKVVSTKRLPFPLLGDVTAAYRVILDLTTRGPNARMMVDVVAIGVRRTETSLVSVAPAQAGTAVLATEQSLARAILGRARP
jgi:hypothetical protein